MLIVACTNQQPDKIVLPRRPGGRAYLMRLDCSCNCMRKIDITSMRPLRLWCKGNLIVGEIPENFDRLLEFEYGVRYE